MGSLLGKDLYNYWHKHPYGSKTEWLVAGNDVQLIWVVRSIRISNYAVLSSSPISGELFYNYWADNAPTTPYYLLPTPRQKFWEDLAISMCVITGWPSAPATARGTIKSVQHVQRSSSIYIPSGAVLNKAINDSINKEIDKMKADAEALLAKWIPVGTKFTSKSGTPMVVSESVNGKVKITVNKSQSDWITNKDLQREVKESIL
jgi:hypothetical protein